LESNFCLHVQGGNLRGYVVWKAIISVWEKYDVSTVRVSVILCIHIVTNVSGDDVASIFKNEKCDNV
jgi:hypothetical protein